MNLQRIEELWARLVADEALEPAEEQELAAALSADAALRMRLLQDEQLDGRLRFRFQQNEASTEKFVHAVGTRIKAEGDASRFTAKVTDQVRTWAGAKQPRVEPGWRWRGAAVGAAAVLLFGVALWQLWPRKQPPPIVDRTPERVGPIVDRHSEAIEPDKIAPRLPEPLYVADVGDNAARGSKDTPLRDIGHAVSRAQPGQTIFVADGQYAAFEIKNVRGTKERPITIKALGKGTTIAAESAKLAAIQITHSRHIVIDGIASRGNKGKAIFVRNSHGVTVRNSVLAENGRNGIEFSHCNDALIENNDIYDNQKSGISFSNSGDRVTIRGNRIRNNTSGVMMGADLAAGGADEVAPDGVISDVLIENNVISDCGSTGAAINLDGIQKAIIRNNVLSNNGASGIALYNASGASGPIDVLIAHNTVDMAATSRPALLLSNLSGAVKVRNNILMARNTARATVFVDSEASSRLIDADRNVFVENLNFKVGDDSEMIDFEAWQALGHDKNSLLASPDELFIEPGRDYHLKAAAPARGRGEILNPAFPDAEGQPRPADTAPDIGAYQRR